MSEQEQNTETKLEPKYHRIDPINFYDLVINVNSLANIQKQENKVYGWGIKAKPENYEKYKQNVKEPMVVLGVIGQGNRGKSYILSKISNIQLPTGYSVTTEGLSIKYPDPEGDVSHKIIVLDSAGSEPPIKETENFSLGEDFDSEASQNEIAAISRDKKMTETFLQNFIINNANIVILVIGQLTFSEQKMYNKLNNLKKKLFVVHNLFNFVGIDQVTDYIDNILVQTMMMNLERQNYVNFNKGSVVGSETDENKYYYIEKVKQDGVERTITHIVIAKEHENSEAGKYFNPPALKFLRALVGAEVFQQRFDVIKSLKNHLVASSIDMIEPKIDEEDVVEEMVDGKNTIYVKNDVLLENGQVKRHKLKQIFMNELGMLSYHSSNFIPKYNCNFNKKNNEIVVQLEFPGTEPKIDLRAKLNGTYNIFTCRGEKIIQGKEPKKDSFYRSNIKVGKFEFNFKVPITKGLLKKKKFAPEFLKDENDVYNGIVQFKVPLEVIEDSGNEVIDL